MVQLHTKFVGPGGPTPIKRPSFRHSSRPPRIRPDLISSPTSAFHNPNANYLQAGCARTFLITSTQQSAPPFPPGRYPMELDATLSGTASEATTELDPTLQGSVDQVIPAQLTQVDLAQDGQFHDRPHGEHLTVGVAITAAAATPEGGQVSVPTATATIGEANQMHTSYTALRVSMERSIERYSDSTAPSLKALTNSTLKGLDAFLVECKQRIDAADGHQDMNQPGVN
ncbi:hypothetical protein PSTT_05401 [Puccinia striiformis]|uniref:Uncharacterized protein n=1 Tax=Puccinia striiformis TaxID=27350 RepID=A0A2S4VNZ2_9BASI|nr:hypothetical protein PSTT_05401 [Puccinia striiformis]